MTPKKMRRIIKLSTALVTIFIVVALVVIGYQLVKIHNLNSQLSRLNAQSASLTVEAEQLERGIEVRRTGSYVEQTAREQYGLVQDGDTIYVEK